MMLIKSISSGNMRKNVFKVSSYFLLILIIVSIVFLCNNVIGAGSVTFDITLSSPDATIGNIFSHFAKWYYYENGSLWSNLPTNYISTQTPFIKYADLKAMIFSHS